MKKLSPTYFMLMALSLFPLAMPSHAKNVSVEQFWQLQQQHKNVLIIDVRTAEEFAQGHLPQAVNIPFDQIQTGMTNYPNKEQPILLYCKSGRRAEIAENQLTTLGYTTLYNGRNYQQLAKTKPTTLK